MCILREQFPDTDPVTTIEVDTDLGLKIGLTSRVFVPTSQCSDAYPFGTQLYRRGDCMYLQAIEIWLPERKKDYFKKLLDTLWNLGFTIKVPNPLRQMEVFLHKNGFEKIDEQKPASTTPDLQVVYHKEPPSTELSG